MSILLRDDTRVMVQGLGRDGSFHAEQMTAYGTNVVAGVHPGRGGQKHNGLPVFDTVEEAVKETGAECSTVFVPARHASDAILEAAHGGIRLVVAVTEGIPTLDMTRVTAELKTLGTRLVGPNSPGVISPGRSLAGILPGRVFRPGPVGVVSRSGTLTYEVVKLLSQAGLGQSTAVGMGGDPVIGMKYRDYLELFENDPETRVVLMVGEIGGSDEQDAAAWAASHCSTPLVGFIVGRSAPPGKRMGHAGAIISGASCTAEAKVEMLRKHGIPVADIIGQVPGLVRERLEGTR